MCYPYREPPIIKSKNSITQNAVVSGGALRSIPSKIRNIAIACIYIICNFRNIKKLIFLDFLSFQAFHKYILFHTITSSEEVST